MASPSTLLTRQVHLPLGYSWRFLGLAALVWFVPNLVVAWNLPVMGSEGLRLWPAVTMLRSADWLLPTFLGDAYINKPPLIYWLIALTFKLSSTYSLFLARLPNVVISFLAALYCGFAVTPPRDDGRAVIATCYLLCGGLIFYSPKAVIDPLYANLFGSSVATVFAIEMGHFSRPLGIVLCGVFLSAAILTKGPLALLLFIPVVLISLKSATIGKRVKLIAIVSGLSLTAGVAWLLCVGGRVGFSEAISIVSFEITRRFYRSEIKNFMNIAETLLLMGPWWLVLLPSVLRPHYRHGPKELRLVYEMSALMVVLSAILFTLPGFLPTYIMPQATVLSLCLGMALARGHSAPIMAAFLPGGLLTASLFVIQIIGCHPAPETVWELSPLIVILVMLAVNRRAVGHHWPQASALAGLVVMLVSIDLARGVIIGPAMPQWQTAAFLARHVQPGSTITVPRLYSQAHNVLFPLAHTGIVMKRNEVTSCHRLPAILDADEMKQAATCARRTAKLRTGENEFDELLRVISVFDDSWDTVYFMSPDVVIYR